MGSQRVGHDWATFMSTLCFICIKIFKHMTIFRDIRAYMCVGYFWKDTQITGNSVYFGLGVIVVQLLSCVWPFVTLWTAACQVSLSFTICWSLLKLMSIDLVMSSNHLLLCCPLLLLLSIFPIIRAFSSESSHQVAKVLELQHQSFQWIFRVDFP